MVESCFLLVRMFFSSFYCVYFGTKPGIIPLKTAQCSHAGSLAEYALSIPMAEAAFAVDASQR